MTEKDWEKLLRIKTTGRDDSRSNTYRYPFQNKFSLFMHSPNVINTYICYNNTHENK